MGSSGYPVAVSVGPEIAEDAPLMLNDLLWCRAGCHQDSEQEEENEHREQSHYRNLRNTKKA